MPYVEVNVDPSDFDTEDLVEEVISRLSRKGRRGLSEKQKAALTAVVEELSEEFGLTGLPIKTLDDKLKVEVILNYWDRYTSFQFEEKLK